MTRLSTSPHPGWDLAEWETAAWEATMERNHMRHFLMKKVSLKSTHGWIFPYDICHIPKEKRCC